MVLIPSLVKSIMCPAKNIITSPAVVVTAIVLEVGQKLVLIREITEIGTKF